ncbi:TetR family transcriptional regulator [Nocardia sp. GTS18]|uniref:TetR family transcriptional regulator n=1 Tax=Nocardia sp. GTS18 TaxID=1778064 RepID=UPI00351A4CD8
MRRTSDADSSTEIINVVVDMLMSEGYDALQVKEVARRARVSLATVYKKFTTRDELIVAAVARWMDINSYAELDQPRPDESLADGLMRVLHHVFEPWERNPRMLEAYHRARRTATGRRLDAQGVSAVWPFAEALFEGMDRDYVEDIALVLTNMIYALTGRFVDRDIEVTDILPILDRAIRRITLHGDPRRAGVDAAPRPSASEPVVDPSFAGPYGPDRPPQ